MTRVFPEPGPAMTSSAPSGAATASSWRSLRPSSRSDGVVRAAVGAGRGMTGVYGARVIELVVDRGKAPVGSVPPRLSGRLYRISGCGRAGVALVGIAGAQRRCGDGWRGWACRAVSATTAGMLRAWSMTSVRARDGRSRPRASPRLHDGRSRRTAVRGGFAVSLRGRNGSRGDSW